MKRIILILITSLMIFSLVGCGEDDTVYDAAYFKDNPKGIELISSDEYDAYAISRVYGKKGFEPKLQILIEESYEGMKLIEVKYADENPDVDIKTFEDELNFYGKNFYFFDYINDKSGNYVATKNGRPFELELNRNYINTIKLTHSDYPELNIWIDYTLKYVEGEFLVDGCQIRANQAVKNNLDHDELMALMGEAQGYINSLANELMDGSNDYKSDASCDDGSLIITASCKPQTNSLYSFIFESEFYK